MPDFGLADADWECLDLAWQALVAGTFPVGSVVVDARGAIVSRGRNTVYGSAEPPLLSGSRLAHAEVNALIWLPVNFRHADTRLVTSLEPCLLCVGALRMATVGALTYLGADPYNGATWALTAERYVGRRPVEITGPRTDQVGRLAAGLGVAFYLRRRPDSAFVAAYRRLRPDLAAAAEALVGAGLFDLAAQDLAWAQVAPALLAAV